MNAPSSRVLPLVTPQTAHFWQGGGSGQLLILRCSRCRWFIHPPAPVCPRCLARDPAPEAVSGRAVLASFTVNHQVWRPDLNEPYVIGIVELPEQRGLRLTTNVINCPPGDVRIGMTLRVVFEQHEDVFLPLFEPIPSC
jgi:hypothetical protein